MKAIYGIQLKDRKIAQNLMLILNETIDPLAMTNCLLVWSNFEDGRVLRGA